MVISQRDAVRMSIEDAISRIISVRTELQDSGGIRRGRFDAIIDELAEAELELRAARDGGMRQQEVNP